MKNITFSNSLKTIEKFAFTSCSSLEYLKFNKNISTIEDYAFYNDESLFEIHIPETMERIGEFAFAECTNLTNVYFSGRISPNCSMNVFDNTTVNAVFVNIHYKNETFCEMEIEYIHEDHSIKKAVGLVLLLIIFFFCLVMIFVVITFTILKMKTVPLNTVSSINSGVYSSF